MEPLPRPLPYLARREGYLHAMRQFGLEPMLMHSDMTERGGRAVMEAFLASGATLPTAIFAHLP
ncbi:MULTISPECIES: hypothetical protein [Pseudarthrobacter]|uniref:hypothetical protein n=1 Tax=Pseudarthrobacter TaxID=1742993 RepID=UPI00204081B9|nr:hypothetical protein [Pseudarthrobacter sp. NCCP-2145]GKV73212.1 hypothetical protein NCCP2145_25930 [Pseudarthrobacter sp. NCCP-2145]